MLNEKLSAKLLLALLFNSSFSSFLHLEIASEFWFWEEPKGRRIQDIRERERAWRGGAK